jgi:hypothetical protein
LFISTIAPSIQNATAKAAQLQKKGKVKKLGYTELQSAEMPDNFVD